MKEITKVCFTNVESKESPKYLKTSANPTLYLFEGENKKFQKKYYPERNFGVSYESPTYFKMKHTLLNENSYKNPYISNPEAYDNELQLTKREKEKKEKITNAQSFKIGESAKHDIFNKVKLPSLQVYE